MNSREGQRLFERDTNLSPVTLSDEDEEHMARYIEDVICDPDGYEGLVFNRFLADCGGKGVAIFWENMIHSAW